MVEKRIFRTRDIVPVGRWRLYMTLLCVTKSIIRILFWDRNRYKDFYLVAFKLWLVNIEEFRQKDISIEAFKELGHWIVVIDIKGDIMEERKI